ncbi:CrcB family protein [Cellulomonas citrea]|uniref:CrcB family protein n=1 Tax=Cellulomonas citrea TaxID=1909423 RepID=UPI001F3D231D|nr:CrcB family protein [Cellulomonas citrea]
MRPRLLALVVVGGAAGTLARSVLESTFPAQPGAWPWTTFVINVTGALLLGALLGYLAAAGPDEGLRRDLRLGIGTGVMGGYTTYSTFIVEVDTLLRNGHVGTGALYAVVAVLLGLAAAAAGLTLGARAGRRS